MVGWGAARPCCPISFSTRMHYAPKRRGHFQEFMAEAHEALRRANLKELIGSNILLQFATRAPQSGGVATAPDRDGEWGPVRPQRLLLFYIDLSGHLLDIVEEEGNKIFVCEKNFIVIRG
jgi:hypothetical protein